MPASIQRADDTSVTISIVPKSLDNPVFMDTKTAAQQAAEDLGITVEWVAPYEADSAQQVEIMHWLINRGVDGILVSSNDPDALRDVIDLGIARGVQIATFDSDSPESERVFYVGTDNYHAGFVAGKTLVDILMTGKSPVGSDDPPDRRGRSVATGGTRGAGDLHDRRVETVILSGRREAHNLNLRIAGFRDAVEEDLNVEIIDILYTDDNITRSIELTEHVVRNRESLDAIFFTGGWPFMAPVDSMENYRQWLEGGGVAVTMDAHYPILLAAQDGMVDGLVGQSFDEMGRVGVQKLYGAIQGEHVDELIYTRSFRVTPENFDEHLTRARNYELK